MMKAVEISRPGGPDVLVPVDMPEPGPGEVLIKVSAAGINRPDVFQRKGAYPPPRASACRPGSGRRNRVRRRGCRRPGDR